MFRTIEDFTQAWKAEAASTLKLLETLTDASLQQRVTPAGRTLGKLAWHLVDTLQEMLPAAGLDVKFSIESAVPAHASEIVANYREGAAQVALAVSGQWTDSDLGVEIEMYGQSWAKGSVLQVLLMHQAHHRGQMTVLMRQAGLAVAGVCGPSAEEWATMGMLPQE